MNEFLEIKKVSVLKFFIDDLEQYDNYTPIKKENIDLLLSTESNYDKESGIFSIILMLTYKTNFNKKVIEILKSDIKFEFYIPQNSKFFNPIEEQKNNQDTKYNVDNSFFSMILSICISTLRGIILEKCRGTFLENIYVPIVDITKLRENNKFRKLANKI